MEARLPPLARDAMNEAQQRLFDKIAAGRPRVVGPQAAFLRNAAIGELTLELSNLCRSGTSLPPRLSELAILIVAGRWRSGYQWQAHEKAGRKAGLPDAAIEALRVGAEPSFARDDETAAYRFLTELLTTHGVSDATFAEVSRHLDKTALVELIVIAGYYITGAMTVRAFNEPAPQGDPFA